MRIVDIMSEELIIPRLRATTKEAALQELVDCIVEHTSVNRSRAFRVLVERERLGSTGVGHGIAIPHAKLPNLENAVACFARSEAGVEFGSLDGRPAHLFLALLAPEGSSGLHLKALARASRMLKDAAFRAQLMDVDDVPDLWSVIQTKDEQLGTQSE